MTNSNTQPGAAPATGNTKKEQEMYAAGIETGEENTKHNAAIRAAAGWLPIESAPKDGTEILAWREDCGQFIARYTSADAFPMTQAELDTYDEATLFAKDWFTQWPQAIRLEGSEIPTLWQPMPADPCPTCNDQGAVGNILTAEPCPSCAAPRASTVQDKPTAYLTLDEDGAPCMLFFDVVEARGYCEVGEEPEALWRHPASAAGDAQDAARYRSFRKALTRMDATWLDRVGAALEALGLNPDDDVLPTAEQVDAAFDAARAEQGERDA